MRDCPKEYKVCRVYCTNLLITKTSERHRFLEETSKRSNMMQLWGGHSKHLVFKHDPMTHGKSQFTWGGLTALASSCSSCAPGHWLLFLSDIQYVQVRGRTWVGKQMKTGASIQITRAHWMVWWGWKSCEFYAMVCAVTSHLNPGDLGETTIITTTTKCGKTFKK